LCPLFPSPPPKVFQPSPSDLARNGVPRGSSVPSLGPLLGAPSSLPNFLTLFFCSFQILTCNPSPSSFFTSSLFLPTYTPMAIIPNHPLTRDPMCLIATVFSQNRQPLFSYSKRAPTSLDANPTVFPFLNSGSRFCLFPRLRPYFWF